MELNARAQLLLGRNPSPVAALRLKRDVLRLPPGDQQLELLLEQVSHSHHVRNLIQEQNPDGGWGAFHTRTTKSKQKTGSTEVAVERAINLGLSPDHACLVRAKNYILSIMHGEFQFPDRHEKNDRWTTGMRLFLASTLSLIDPSNEELDQDRALWRDIVVRSFRSGAYSEKDEILAHRELTGASVKNSYLTIDNRYTLNILGSKGGLLPMEVETAFVKWLWSRDEGIGYLEAPLSKMPQFSAPGPFERWTISLEMMSRLALRSARFLAKQIMCIWERQDQEGLWDFGSRAAFSTFLPLSDTWRSRSDRKVDWSTRVLLLASNWLRERADSSA